MGTKLRGMWSETPTSFWKEITNKNELKLFREEMFRNDKKNRKYNYSLNIMVDSGNKKHHETMDYFGFSFEYNFMKRMDKLATENEYEFRVALLQQLFFENIYMQFKDAIRYATITYGNVYRYQNGKYELQFEEPKLHVIFESVVEEVMKEKINNSIIRELENFGYKR